MGALPWFSKYRSGVRCKKMDHEPSFFLLLLHLPPCLVLLIPSIYPALAVSGVRGSKDFHSLFSFVSSLLSSGPSTFLHLCPFISCHIYPGTHVRTLLANIPDSSLPFFGHVIFHDNCKTLYTHTLPV